MQRSVRVLVGAIAACLALGASVPLALASHSVVFQQRQLKADTATTLSLRVPEAGEDHNPEGAAEHYTTQVNVTVPEGFALTGACQPPSPGWGCATTGSVVRFYLEGARLTSAEVDDAPLRFGVRTADSNGTYGFRTVQVYNDGHETRFTVPGGTAPTVEVTGAPPPQPSPSSPSPAADPDEEATEAAPPPSDDRPTSTASPTAAGASPSDTPSPSPSAAPLEDRTPTPSPSPAVIGPSDGLDEDLTATEPTDDGPRPLLQAALSMLLVAGGWTLVEWRQRQV